MNRLLIIAVLLPAVVAAGCAAPAAPTQAPPTNEPVALTATPAPSTPTEPTPADDAGKITGNISDIQPGQGDTLGTVRIEGEKIPDNTFDKAVLTVTADTLIFRQSGDELVPAEFADLAFGQTVTAEVVGPVMESYPIQAGAGKITILFEAPRN